MVNQVSSRSQGISPVLRINEPRRQLLVLGTGALAASLLPLTGHAQTWPTKSIKLIAAQAPGSSNDATARAFADYFSSRLGVPVVVENRPGGLGMIAAEAVAHAPADGHTLLITLHSQLAQAPVLLKKPPIDTNKDLVPIGSIGVGPVVAAVHKDLPVKNIAELIELARKRPVSVGNYAIGSGWQLMLTKLAAQTGAQFTIVNYKGTGAMLMDLYSGQIEIGAGSLAGMGAGIQKGFIRPVVIIIGNRSNKLPGIPTWVDAGYSGPAFEDLAECNMLLGPAGMPPQVVDRLARLIHDSVTDSPRVKAVREQLAADDVPLTGAALQQFIHRTWASYRSLSRETGLTVE